MLQALRTGADIGLWLKGPAEDLATRYTRLDHITEGRDALLPLLTGRDEAGLARVLQPAGEFIVVLPKNTEPAIAWAAPNPDAGRGRVKEADT
ncbi:hypothetical protein [Actinomadura parmotrematis]|uniref:SseB family protein n=1 Tax=Actinomadura parmotrematis TaxID=2864039 RepID=A0ABS7FYM6_9ACTN|nr:hypothetical protein [Actinomadura parmotrematis]MBW8485540.1 hypothetical protein [Actinomadura parmotrematis]